MMKCSDQGWSAEHGPLKASWMTNVFSWLVNKHIDIWLTWRSHIAVQGLQIMSHIPSLLWWLRSRVFWENLPLGWFLLQEQSVSTFSVSFETWACASLPICLVKNKPRTLSSLSHKQHQQESKGRKVSLPLGCCRGSTVHSALLIVQMKVNLLAFRDLSLINAMFSCVSSCFSGCSSVYDVLILSHLSLQRLDLLY